MKWAKKDEAFVFAEAEAYPKMMLRKKERMNDFTKMIFLEGFKAGYNKAYRKYVRDKEVLND